MPLLGLQPFDPSAWRQGSAPPIKRDPKEAAKKAGAVPSRGQTALSGAANVAPPPDDSEPQLVGQLKVTAIIVLISGRWTPSSGSTAAK